MKVEFLLACTICITAVGCSSTRQDEIDYPEFRSPLEGKIQIAIYGDVRSPGVHWVDAPADLGAASEVAGGWTTGQPPLHALVRRETSDGKLEHVLYLLPEMNEPEIEDVSLKHGNIIWYYTMFPQTPSWWYKSPQNE